MFRLRALLAFCVVALLVGTSSGQQPMQPMVQKHRATEIPPDHWNFGRLADLKLKAIRVNLVSIPVVVPAENPGLGVDNVLVPDVEVRVLVEFLESLTPSDLADLKRRLNQNPGLYAPYTLVFLNADRRVKTVPIGKILDEVTGRAGDRFEMLFLLPREVHDFEPTDADFRAP